MRLKLSIVFSFAVCVLCIPVDVSAQQNPFFGGSQESGPTSRDAAVLDEAESIRLDVHPVFRGRSFFPRLNAFLRSQQRVLNERFSALLFEHTDGNTEQSSRSMIPLITVVAFLYGLFHAALPGHRKVLLVSYFVSTPSKVRHAISAGIAVAVVHSGAAAIVILAAYYLIGMSLSAAMDTATFYLQAITAVMVLVVSILILTVKVRGLLRLRRGHEHTGTTEEAGRIRRVLRKRFGVLPAIVLSAVVPCPGSAMILLFALSLGVVSLGLYAVVVFSLGMAVTLSTVLVITVLSKKVLFNSLDGRAGEALHLGFEGLGGVAMVLFAVVLLIPYF